MLFRRGEYSHPYLFPGIEGTSSSFSHWSQYERQASIYGHISFLLNTYFLYVVCWSIFKYCWILLDYFLHLIKCPHGFYPILLVRSTSFRFVYVECMLCWDRSYLILTNGPSVCHWIQFSNISMRLFFHLSSSGTLADNFLLLYYPCLIFLLR